MSTSYTANFGIGYEVKAANEEMLEDHEGDLHEYLYMQDYPGFESFETGSYYSGEMEGVFLVVSHDFSKGNDLSKSKAKLEEQIKKLGLETVGDFGLVGGILIS